MVKSGRKETLILADSQNQRLPLTSCTLTCRSHDQFDMDWWWGDPPKPSREPKSFCVWLLKTFEGGKLSYPSFIHSRVLKFFFLLIVSLLRDTSFPTTDRSSWALELNPSVRLLEGILPQLKGKLGFQAGDHFTVHSVGFKFPLQTWKLPHPHSYPKSCFICICISRGHLSL